MINIKIIKDNQGFIWSFIIKGHAGYNKKGRDIVCAGVSSIAYTAIGALAQMADVDNYTEKDGYIKCTIPNDISEDMKHIAKIILDSMFIGLRQIENSYNKYVFIEEEEV